MIGLDPVGSPIPPNNSPTLENDRVTIKSIGLLSQRDVSKQVMNLSALKFLVFVLLNSLLFQCVDPIDLPVRDIQPELVIEGFITNEYGPHVIRLTRTSDFTTPFEVAGVIEREEGATVGLRDSDGLYTELRDIGRGYYATSESFRGVVGKSYTLSIETKIRESYISQPVTIPEGAEIDDVLLRYDRKPSLNEFDFTSGINAFVVFEDNAETQDFYLLNHSDGVYPWTAHPEDATNALSPCFPSNFSTNCFRYERDYYDAVEIPELIPCLRRSFASFGFRTIDDQAFDGKQATILASFIEDDGRRFEYSYRANINLYTIEDDAFAFYQRLDQQLEISGDIFDPPPSPVQGNMIDLDNPSVRPFGYFGAFYVSRKMVYMERDLLEDVQTKVRFAGDCTNMDSSAVFKPLDWEGSSW